MIRQYSRSELPTWLANDSPKDRLVHSKLFSLTAMGCGDPHAALPNLTHISTVQQGHPLGMRVSAAASHHESRHATPHCAY